MLTGRPAQTQHPRAGFQIDDLMLNLLLVDFHNKMAQSAT